MVEIRDARIDDIEKMCMVNAYSWLTTYKDILPRYILEERLKALDTRIKNTKKDLIEHPDHIKLVALFDDLIVGMSYAGISETKKYPNIGEIYNLYILKEYQHLGIGKKMFYEAVKRLVYSGFNEMIIKCIKDNPSCFFYEKIGGVKIGEDIASIYGYEVMENIYYYDDLKKKVKEYGRRWKY